MKKKDYSQPLVSVLMFSSDVMDTPNQTNPASNTDWEYSAPARNLYV